MPKKLCMGLYILVVSVLTSSVPLDGVFADRDVGCADIMVVFARGSGESLGDVSYQSFTGAVGEVFAQRAPDLRLNYYELGSGSYGGASYPAVAVDNLINSTGALISMGNNFAFGKSVDKGVTELTSLISAYSATCPEMKYLIAGYSQGAMVVSRALSEITERDKILYAATIADPKVYLPEGETSVIGATPPACRGQNLSVYRANVPDCTVSSGILGGLKTYAKGYTAGKVGTWCHRGDPICGSFPTLGAISSNGIIAEHLTYVSDDTYREVANNAVSSVKGLALTASSKRDTAILIDTTGSMGELIERYKTEALKVAKKTVEQGGRIALYEFRDELREDFAPRKLCDFSCSYAEFEEKLNQIELDGGDDEPESALSALLKTMNELTWQQGATKSIVLLTDASYHTVDVGGVTLDQVVQRSREIDPVNVYVLVEPELVDYYRELADGTGGEVFVSGADEESGLGGSGIGGLGDFVDSTEYLLERPSAVLARESYYAYPGEEVLFDAAGSSAVNMVDHYEWDLDFDGVYEFTTNDSNVTKTYGAPVSGWMQMKVVDRVGLASNMTAWVTIMDPSKVAKIESYAVEYISDSEAKLTLQAVNAGYFVLQRDDQLVRFSMNEVVYLTDVGGGVTSLRVIPVDENGRVGEAVEVEVAGGGVGMGGAESVEMETWLRAPATGVS